MRWGPLVIAAIALACNAAPTSSAPTPPDQDAEAARQSMTLLVDPSVVIVRGESVVLSFDVVSLPEGLHVAAEGLPPGVTADPVDFVRQADLRYSIVLHAASDAPESIVKILVHASAPGFSDANAVSTLTVSSFDGSLDPSFGTAGIARFTLPSEASGPVAIARASATSAQMILALTSGSPRLVVTRLDDTGAIDTTFGKSGIARADFGSPCDHGVALAIASDGRIALSGATESGCGGDMGTSPMPEGIVSFTSDGALVATTKTASIAPLVWSGSSLIAASDSTLDCFTGTSDTPSSLGGFAPIALATRSDGSLIAVGTLVTRRLVPNGDGTYALDPSYAAPVGGRALVVDEQDRVVVLGDTTLTRLTPSGSLDSSFGAQGIAPLANGTGEPAAIVKTASGAFVVVGNGAIAKTTNLWITLFRYDATGSPVAAFGSFGTTITHIPNDEVHAVSAALDSSGRLWVLASTAQDPSTAILRYRLAP